jgi:transcriptional regulator with XRE-family HTH domain
MLEDAERRTYEIVDEMVRARKELGLTQAEVSRMAGCTQSNLSQIERCKSRPSLRTVLMVLTPMGKTLKIVDK